MGMRDGKKNKTKQGIDFVPNSISFKFTVLRKDDPFIINKIVELHVRPKPRNYK